MQKIWYALQEVIKNNCSHSYFSRQLFYVGQFYLLSVYSRITIFVQRNNVTFFCFVVSLIIDETVNQNNYQPQQLILLESELVGYSFSIDIKIVHRVFVSSNNVSYTRPVLNLV